MKLFLQGLAFVLLFGVIYVTIMNGGDTITVNILAPQYDVVTETTHHVSKNLNFAFFTISVLGAGLISGLCLFAPFYLAQTEQLYAYKRELEKSSVKTDSSTSQVKVLQAKIEVLERALKEALK